MSPDGQRARFEQLEADVRGRVGAAWPELLAGRAGPPPKRLPTSGFDGAARTSQTKLEPAHRWSIFGIDIEWAAEARWLDDGGR